MRYLLCACAIVLIAAGCSQPAISPRPWMLQELEVEVADTSREVSFTNKQAGFYYTESNAPRSNSWQGWHIMSVRMMDDYGISIDGVPLDRSTISSASVRPDALTRRYRNGVRETVTMLDSVDALAVTIEGSSASMLSVTPIFKGVSAAEFSTDFRDGTLLVAKRGHLARTTKEDYPVWIGIAALKTEGVTYRTSGTAGEISVSPQAGKTTFLFVAGDSQEDVLSCVQDLRTSFERRSIERRQRMERILNASLFRSSNARFDRALAWAKLSLDALIMRQDKTGIFAGLPWFSNYWGRDTFISLPGATLVTGDVSKARDILRTFAAWQQMDPSSPDEGRIPNLVTPTSTSYNTTDGTPWFVLGVFDYVKYSGDTAFVREIFPVLRRALEGALRHRVDREQFLLHGDAETWMDAVGPDGPWSPRGNRANDVQALWYRQIMVSTFFAEMQRDMETAARWNEVGQSVLRNFQQRFVDPEKGLIVDHLNSDGTADSSMRPNQLFALDVVVDPEVREHIFRRITETLVYEHGVGSLASSDPNFHPYHEFPPFYPKDAAYHNGVVWTWLAGPWIKTAVEFGRPNTAFRVTENLVQQILDVGAVGTIPELLDAATRPGERLPQESGTFSQAWSLAEFIRTTYQSYLGVSVDAPNRQLWLLPQLPMAMSSAIFDVHVGPAKVRISIDGNGQTGQIVVLSLEQTEPLSINVGWPFATRRGRSCSFTLQPGQRVELELTEKEAIARSERPDEIAIDTQIQPLAEFPGLADLELAVPIVPAGLRSLRGPAHRLLTNGEIQMRPAPERTLVDAQDPEHDDRGTGNFVYPTTPHLRPGSLDMTNFRVTSDDSVARFRMTFRALSDPGWHPEYGFQLTYAAIAIDTDRSGGSGQRIVGRNARFTLPSERAYERIVFVGGGVRIEDQRGGVLAEYVPLSDDSKACLGDVSTRTVSFSLPLSLIGGDPSKWRFSVLVGAQDDHGGAGIGDFRSVERAAGEWHGGGRQSTAEPNVYDVVLIR